MPPPTASLASDRGSGWSASSVESVGPMQLTAKRSAATAAVGASRWTMFFSDLICAYSLARAEFRRRRPCEGSAHGEHEARVGLVNEARAAGLTFQEPQTFR